jgi:hypothetical protein
MGKGEKTRTFASARWLKGKAAGPMSQEGKEGYLVRHSRSQVGTFAPAAVQIASRAAIRHPSGVAAQHAYLLRAIKPAPERCWVI